MQVNEELSNFVFLKAFKGFQVSLANGLLEAKLRLNADEKKEILAHHDDFGYLSSREMRPVIDMVIGEHVGISLQSYADLSLLSLPIGSIIHIRRKHEALLKLIYVDRYVFRVVHDNTNALLPGDVLRSLVIGICSGEPLYCLLFRNGKRIPDAQQVLAIDYITDVLCRTPQNNRLTRVEIKRHSYITSLPIVYAWKAVQKNSKTLIPYSEITDNCKAAIKIDLNECSIEYNDLCDKNIYSSNNCNIFDDVLGLVIAGGCINSKINKTDSKGYWKNGDDGLEVYLKMVVK